MNKTYLILLISIIYINSCSLEPITPEELFTITGTISDALANVPVEGAAVYFDVKMDTTDEEGYYSLTDIKPGHYLYKIIHPQYDTLKGEKNIEGNMELHFQLHLIDSLRYKNIVVNIFDDFDPDPFPVTNAELLLNGGLYNSNDSGKVYIENIEIGTYRVIISHPQYENYDTYLKIEYWTYAYDIILTPLYYDYFPFSMQQNSLFRYNLQSIHASGNGTISRGTKEYRYRRSDVNGNNIIHRYDEFENDTLIIIEQPDTIIVINFSYNPIGIVETEDHSLFADNPFFLNSIYYNGLGRFIPISRGDSLYIWFQHWPNSIAEGFYLMKPDYGIIYFYGYGGTGMHPDYWYAWRTE